MRAQGSLQLNFQSGSQPQLRAKKFKPINKIRVKYNSETVQILVLKQKLKINFYIFNLL